MTVTTCCRHHGHWPISPSGDKMIHSITVIRHQQWFFIATVLWIDHHHCHPLFKMRKEISSISHLTPTRLRAPQTLMRSPFQWQSYVWAIPTHGYPFGPASRKVRELYGTKYLTLISKNILIALIAVMFTLYYHKLFKDTQKELKRRGNCPLVESPGGETGYTLFLVELTRTRGPSDPSGFRPVSLFFSDSTFLFHNK